MLLDTILAGICLAVLFVLYFVAKDIHQPARPEQNQPLVAPTFVYTPEASKQASDRRFQEEIYTKVLRRNNTSPDNRH